MFELWQLLVIIGGILILIVLLIVIICICRKKKSGSVPKGPGQIKQKRYKTKEQVGVVDVT